MTELYLRVSSAVLRAVSIAALGVIVLINAANIVSRAVFHADMEWIQEASIIGAMVIYFYAIALISKGNGDIRMDFFVRVLPPAWQTALGLLARVLVILFQFAVLILAIETLGFVSVFRTPVLQLPESVFFIPLIAGAADILVTEVIYFVRQARGAMPAPGAGASGTELLD